ncbi:hypothetical protein MTR_1g113950 [Medicago truncatula]|uniref:Uncharacterized protein n=1 Tax=Medicago truncatula TaxID=3880 RepID=G7IDD2_MEDTR|nr:hypothetical protein MTR_1g113950 [Medicago truncatula]
MFTYSRSKDRSSFFLHRNREQTRIRWIMKEYGNEQSWTKLLSVPHIHIPRQYIFQKMTK